MTTIQIKKDGQDPQIINVTEGAKIIIEDGGTIVEPEFKDGDIVYWENDSPTACVAIFKKWHSCSECCFDYYFNIRTDLSRILFHDWGNCSVDSKRSMRLATESERQLLFDVLKKDGKQWNPSAKQIEELKWKPKINEKYYVPSPSKESLYYVYTNNDCEFDTHRINKNLAFKTPEEAIEVSKRWLQQL